MGSDHRMTVYRIEFEVRTDEWKWFSQRQMTKLALKLGFLEYSGQETEINK